ncbi:unnamed protein product [Owenia fusiformis]|uniref:Uncharacterized protein n=1 Tax=Owenia fusiformis TaxID=6347 RepID=A0A8J1XF79_OWEFU|nr:unnamed protein product [Owenia fusiformis]
MYIQVVSVLSVMCCSLMLHFVEGQHTHFSTGWAPGFGVGKRGGMKDYPTENCEEKLQTYMRILEKIYSDGDEDVISYALPKFLNRIERLTKECQDNLKPFYAETNRINPNGAE